MSDAQQATNSHIAMLRGVIALAWADHALNADEKTQLGAYVNNNHQLSDAQRVELLASIDHKIELAQIWPEVTDMHDRAHLLNIADVIFAKDGNYCKEEQDAYQRIHAEHMASINTEAIEAEIGAMAVQLRSEREALERDMQEQVSPLRLLTRMAAGVFGAK